MKRLLTCISVCFAFKAFSQVGLGTTSPATSAALHVHSTTKGFLPPRMTVQQRNSITNPDLGLTIFNTTSDCLNFYRAGGWYDPCASIAAAIGGQPLNELLGGNSADVPHDIQQTTDGGFIIAGYSYSSASGNVSNVNQGDLDYWIVKLDAAGNIQWNKLLGGSGTDIATSVRQTPDGGYIVAGQTNSSLSGDVTDTSHGSIDLWLVKLNSTGNVSWNLLLGGGGVDDFPSIRVISDGDYILSARSTSSNSGDVSSSNNGPIYTSDFWIAKLNGGSGAVIWNKLVGGAASEIVPDIQQTVDGGFILSGQSESNSVDTALTHGSADYLLVKISAAGNTQWTRLLGGNQLDGRCRVIQTADDGFVIAGISLSSGSGNVTDTVPQGWGYNVWVAKLDTAGSIIWNNLLGGAGYEQSGFYTGVSILQSSDGGYIISCSSSSAQSGDVTGVSHGLDDYWVVKLNTSGQPVWNRLLGGGQSESQSAATLTSDGGCVILGATRPLMEM